MSIDMMKYWKKVFKKPYPDGWKDKPNKTTPIRGKVMDAYDSAMDEIDSRVLSLGKSVIDHDFRIEQNEGRFSIVFKEIEKENGLIAELADTKITKIYAGNNGATVLTDSDNGKIQDMILYGKSEQKQYSGKNLLNCSGLTEKTINGVTFTPVYENGMLQYINVNGTATANTAFNLFSTVEETKAFLSSYKGKTLRCVGCPSGGGNNKYAFGIQGGDIDATGNYDYGVGKNVIISDSIDTFTTVWLKILIFSGQTVNNLVFKPMIVDADLYPDVTYDDFEPYTGGIPSPNPDYPQEIKSVVNPVVTLSDGENSQTVTLPFTLNAIPVSEGGNITIDGQQYIADYVDVENGKLHRLVGSSLFDESVSLIDNTDWLLSSEVITDLTDEQINALKALSTYYPTTNIAVTSDELDGYVTFNYPLCFESAAEYAVGSLQFAFESGLPKSTFRIYGSDSKESMYDIRIAVFDSTGAPKQLTQFSLYAYGGKSVGNGTVNTSYGTIRQSGSGYIQLETKEDYNWKVWISGKGWRVEKV